MNIITLWSLVILGVIGIVAAVVLYFVAKKFNVEEDPLIGEVEEVLAGANCGGCGYAGCRNFAEACVKSAVEKRSLAGLSCPSSDMSRVAGILGLSVVESEPMIAVVRCVGSCENAPKKVHYEGAGICAFATTLYAGESGCPDGCLGLGDCVRRCAYDAIHINEETCLPEVDEDRCVGCGVCAKSCPRGVIELRAKGRNGRRVYVSCNNREKGAVAMKNCKVSCIGCQKCYKTCPFGAIEMRGNLAYIDYSKCKQCRKCVEVCPRGSIAEVNFPPRKAKVEAVQTTEKQDNNESKE